MFAIQLNMPVVMVWCNNGSEAPELHNDGSDVCCQHSTHKRAIAMYFKTCKHGMPSYLPAWLQLSQSAHVCAGHSPPCDRAHSALGAPKGSPATLVAAAPSSRPGECHEQHLPASCPASSESSITQVHRTPRSTRGKARKYPELMN